MSEDQSGSHDDGQNNNQRPKLSLNTSGSKIVRQNLSIGRSKNVSVEIRRKKTPQGSFIKKESGGLTSVEVEDRMNAVKNAMREKIEKEKDEQARRIREKLEQEKLAQVKAEEAKILKTIQEEKPYIASPAPTHQRSENQSRSEGEGYKPRSEGGYRPRSEGEGYRSRSEGGYRPRQEGEGYKPRPEGGYRPRPEGEGYKPRPEGGYRPRPEGEGYKPRPEGGYRPRPEGEGYKPRSEGGYRSRPEGEGYKPRPEGGYRPRPEGEGYKPRSEGGYRPRQEGEGYTPRPEGGYRPRPEGGYNRPRTEGGEYRPRPEGGYNRPRQEGVFKPRPDDSAPLILEEGKRRPDLSKKDREKKIKKFGETSVTPDSKKAPQNDKRQSKRVDLTRYKDIENLDESNDNSPEARLWMKKRHKNRKEEIIDTGALIAREVIIPKTIVVSELANRMAIRASDVIKKLMQQGMFVTVNQVIDGDIAEIVCAEFGHIPKRVSEEDVEKILVQKVEVGDLIERAPVVTVMGHVDHGKTSLLDALRKTSVVKGEAGGITQHIGAYRVFTKSKKPIVFIDTPGHAAFSSMRSRGAHLTDIVILVVAGDDGVKTQTIEAIHHAKAAKVPMIVAVNKMDLPGADASRVCSELLQHEIVTEGFGGDVMVVEVSAKTGQGLEKLEDDILLLAETLELRASPHQKAEGVVVEATQEKGRGAVATVLVQSGTLRVGDIFVVGKTYGKVKLMLDEFSQDIKEALPSTPVRVLGLDMVPEAGDVFNVVDDDQTAVSIAESRARREKDEVEAKKVKTGGLVGLLQNVADSEIKMLPVIIKGDVHGSVEAIKQSLEKLSDENARVNILHAAVGPVSENDVSLAKASQGVIIAFNVRANAKARDIARQDNVEIFYHSIIYNVIEDIQGIIKGFLKPVFRDKFIGYAEIRQVFNVTKVGKIAGCMITEGIVQRGAKVRLLRDNVVIHEGKLKTLKRFKDEVKEVKQGYECGMAFENYDDIKIGDLIECSVEEEVIA